MADGASPPPAASDASPTPSASAGVPPSLTFASTGETSPPPVPSAVNASIPPVPSAVNASIPPVPSAVDASPPSVPSAVDASIPPVPSAVDASIPPVPSAVNASPPPVPSAVDASPPPVPSTLHALPHAFFTAAGDNSLHAFIAAVNASPAALTAAGDASPRAFTAAGDGHLPTAAAAPSAAQLSHPSVDLFLRHSPRPLDAPSPPSPPAARPASARTPPLPKPRAKRPSSARPAASPYHTAPHTCGWVPCGHALPKRASSASSAPPPPAAAPKGERWTPAHTRSAVRRGVVAGVHLLHVSGGALRDYSAWVDAASPPPLAPHRFVCRPPQDAPAAGARRSRLKEPTAASASRATAKHAPPAGASAGCGFGAAVRFGPREQVHLMDKLKKGPHERPVSSLLSTGVTEYRNAYQYAPDFRPGFPQRKMISSVAPPSARGQDSMHDRGVGSCFTATASSANTVCTLHSRSMRQGKCSQ